MGWQWEALEYSLEQAFGRCLEGVPPFEEIAPSARCFFTHRTLEWRLSMM